MTESYTVQCPFCGETNEFPLDLAGDYPSDGQTCTEDCAVCCNPMTIAVHIGPDGRVERVEVEKENP